MRADKHLVLRLARVEPLIAARTLLADFFNSLLAPLLCHGVHGMVLPL